MSRRVWDLSRSKQSQHRRSIERLVAAGADLDRSDIVKEETPALRLTTIPGIPGSYAHALGSRSFYVVYARIVVLAPKVSVQEIDLSSPSWDLQAWLLADPMVDKSQQLYRTLGGIFHRNEVLNHRLDTGKLFRRGDVLEGAILAESCEPIPSQYGEGSAVPIRLRIVDQFDNVYESNVDLLVERAAINDQPQPHRRSTLFDGEDSRIGAAERNVSEVAVYSESPEPAKRPPGSDLSDTSPARGGPGDPGLETG